MTKEVKQEQLPKLNDEVLLQYPRDVEWQKQQMERAQQLNAEAEQGEPKEWVGLNGADWNDFNFLLSNDPHRVADWVEKILRERNT
jgi:hypothetical protein